MSLFRDFPDHSTISPRRLIALAKPPSNWRRLPPLSATRTPQGRLAALGDDPQLADASRSSSIKSYAAQFVVVGLFAENHGLYHGLLRLTVERMEQAFQLPEETVVLRLEIPVHFGVQQT